MRKFVVPFIAALALVALPAQADRGYYGRGGNGHHGGGRVYPWAGLAGVGALARLQSITPEVYAARSHVIMTYDFPLAQAIVIIPGIDTEQNRRVEDWL